MTASASRAAETDPRVIHRLPGRIRVHLPGWGEAEPAAVERALVELPGVHRARANPLTRNVLVQFDPAEVDEGAIVTALASGLPMPQAEQSPAQPQTTATSGASRTASANPHHTVREIGLLRRRARIAVRGIDRDPELAGKVVERLGRLSGVSRVTASQLTGRVLVEYSEHLLDLDDLLTQVSRFELPDLPGEDTPSHPMDPAPILQSTARAVGSGLGLGLIMARRALSGPGALSADGAGARLAGTIGIIEGLPPVEQRLEQLVGRDSAQLILGGMAIVGLTFAGSPLGLAVSGAGALRLMTAVRARRAAWREYEERVADAEPAHPGAEVELAAGERTPLPGTVTDGFGTALSASGELVAAAPGSHLDSGARIAGGPLTVQLDCDPGFEPQPRAAARTPKSYDRYLSLLPPASLAYAALTALITRSPGRTLTALLLVNPRAALIGAQSADNGAEARILRQGVTVVGSREQRPVCVPDVLVVESPRVLMAGLQIEEAEATSPDHDQADVLRIAAGISAAAGSPWGPVFSRHDACAAVDGTFDGRVASAELSGERWLLAPARHQPARGGHVLELHRSKRSTPVGRIQLELAPAAGLDELLETCRRAGVPVEVAGELSPGLVRLTQHLPIDLRSGDALARVRDHQSRGGVVAVVSDTGHAGPEFAQCDLAIALSSGRSGRFAARADLLAPDLSGVAAIVHAGTLRDAAARDSMAVSVLANLAGAAWGWGGNPQFHRASQATYVAALGAIVAGFIRMRGGARPRSVAERLFDPEPERFGRLSVNEALSALGSRPDGLSTGDAQARARAPAEREQRHPVWDAVLDQLNSPLTMVLGGGAAVSLALGTMGDVAIIGAVIAVNTAVGAWQERQAGRAADALQRMSAREATVRRDGRRLRLEADGLVAGDVIELAAGDRVPADARLIEAQELEVDEAALTGESIPVAKAVEGGTDESRIVLEGSDVTVGTARAVVIAVGRETRMGATAAAIMLEETRESPLGQKLSRMFSQSLPLIGAGGLLVTAAGLVWGRPLISQLALGASVAIGAVPEGLPLLAGVAQAAVARRLTGRNALVRRLAAVEALGRVDIVCTDKTGTLTEGRPALTCVSMPDGRRGALDELNPELRRVLDAAALASPHPDAPALASHPTDVAVVEGAERAGLTTARDADRHDEASFEPSRGFHATRADGRLFVKGAVEEVLGRCTSVRSRDGVRPLGAHDREALLSEAESLSGEGLRVLMVAERGSEGSAENPTDLTALGFVGISDPLRPGVADAVRRCETAGVRVVMLTGDHPATARAIAQQAGLARNGAAVLTGPELAQLGDEELARRLEHARVIARISPLDKLRIVEALQGRGHVVAMTGDGVNDAPALRLADVGVAMGRTGTDVAREAADLVLADDDFSTLVESFVEGRGFWHNIRRALALLLGGNAGELGLMVAAGICGLPAPLTTRQVLTVNLITDVLPALSVAVQHPEHRDLASLSREGTSALDAPLRRSILYRGLATSLPSFAAYVLGYRGRDLARSRAVGFTSIVLTQLAQTLDVGRAEGRLSREVIGAVGGTAAFVAAALAFPPLQNFLGLALPTLFGLALCGAAALAAVLFSRKLSRENHLHPSSN